MDTNNLKRLILAVLCGGLIFSRVSYGQEDLISFYPKAYAKTQNPPEEKKLIIIAEQKMEDKYVTFVGVEKGKVLLAAITKDKINNPKKSIYLKVRHEKEMKRLQRPYITISYARKISLDPGEIIDWGYIFDRNGDGKIDYVSYLIGALPVKQENFPADFPKRGDATELFENLYHFGLFMSCGQLIFAHYSDDNFDGKIDGAVIERMDLERDWVDKWMLLRSSNFDEVCDTCWFFKGDPSLKQGNCLRTSKGYWAHRVGGSVDFGKEEFIKFSNILSIINQAAESCGLTKDSFYKE